MTEARYGGNGVFREYTQHGDLGVDFFFVISGFIILFAHSKDLGRPATWPQYVHRRLVRLFPVYWLYTSVFVALLAFGLGTNATMPASITDWLTTYTLIRFSAASPPIAPAWTLFHELGFYALFSLLLLNKRLGGAALLAWGGICALLYHFPGLSDRTALVVYTSAYGLYFLFGMAAYSLYRRGGSGVLETVTGLLLAAAWFALLSSPYQLSKLVMAAAFALMLSGITKMEAAGLLRAPRVLTYIGNASYSIYLTHIAVEGLLLKIAAKAHLSERFGPEITYLLTLTGAIGIGCVAYATVEEPMLAWIRRRWPGKPPVRHLPATSQNAIS